MNDDTFENLEIWQEAMELAVFVYELFRGCGDRDFRAQIQAAALSVSSNIAEGYERDTNQELIRFCVIAKGSCGEVRSQAHVARRIRLLAEGDGDRLIEQARRLSKRIARFIAVRRSDF